MKKQDASRWGLPLALALLLVSGTVWRQSTRKFYSDDPITVEPETQDASKVANFKIDLFYDLMLNQFTRPGEPAGPRAKNVNTIDEVPDSSWFTNRILDETGQCRRGGRMAQPRAPAPLRENGR